MMESRTSGRQREGMERLLERRRRENVAPRLLALFPGLQALRIRLREDRCRGYPGSEACLRMLRYAAVAVYCE